MFEQDRVLVRLQQRVLREPDILTCFLSGSFGRRQEDAYSDMDVALVFADEPARAAAWENRRSFVQSVLPYVPARSFDGAHIRPFFHIVLYSNGAKVDYRYETQETLQPNPWDQDLRLLKDTADWGQQFQAACAQTYFKRPYLSVEELTDLDNRFWVMFWDVYRQVLRGDYDKPFPIYLQVLHFTLPSFLAVLPPEDPAYQGLLQAHYSHDTQATVTQLAHLLEAYLAARTAVIDRLNLAFDTHQSFESAVQKLVQRTS